MPVSLRQPFGSTASRGATCQSNTISPTVLPAKRRKQVVANASAVKQAAAAAAAAFVMLTPVAMDVMAPPPALADYADRLEALERRKALMAKAREDALSKASAVEQEEAPGTTAPAPETSLFSGFGGLEDTYKSLQQKQAPAPAASAPEEEEPAPKLGFGGFSLPKLPEAAPAPTPVVPPPPPAPKAVSPASTPPAEQSSGGAWWEKLSDPSLFESPAPAPATSPPPPPAPKPAPMAPPTPAPEPVKVEAKKASEPAKKPEPVAVKSEPVSKKRKGPLPLWLAEFLVLGVYVGIGLAATKYNSQATAALQTAGGVIATAYGKVEGLMSKKQ